MTNQYKQNKPKIQQGSNFRKNDLGMGHSHLYVSLTLRHITQKGKRTSSRFEVPHQMSNTIWIVRNRTILGMRELPMKRLRNSRFTRYTKTMVRTIRFSFLRRKITPLRTRWATRLNTSNIFFTLRIFGPLGWRPRKSVLLTKNFCSASLTSSNWIRSALALPVRVCTLSESRELDLLDVMFL